MPKGPKGERRPADVVGAAIMVAKIAVGEVEENTPAREGKEYARKGGLKGGKARAKALTPNPVFWCKGHQPIQGDKR